MCYYKCCNKVIRVFLTFIDHETESREGENYILQVLNFLWPKKFKIYIYFFLHVENFHKNISYVIDIIVYRDQINVNKKQCNKSNGFKSVILYIVVSRKNIKRHHGYKYKVKDASEI